jgi:hypothetical protein
MSDYGPLFAGLDPGLSGGIGLLDADGGFQAAYPWGDTERDTFELIAEVAPKIELACLEIASSRPGQGISSNFKFATSWGLLRGFLIALKIPFQDISPQKWTKNLGLRAGKTTSYSQRKRLHKQWAQQWFPRLQITHHTADAILIAEYARRTMAPPPLIAMADDPKFRELVK